MSLVDPPHRDLFKLTTCDAVFSFTIASIIGYRVTTEFPFAVNTVCNPSHTLFL